MVEEEESGGEEWRGESGGELKRGRALIIRLTHSIEGSSQTTCRRELENSNYRVPFRYRNPVAVKKTFSQRVAIYLVVCLCLCVFEDKRRSKRDYCLCID